MQDNAERTASFVVLINLLRPLDASRWPSPASNENFAARNQKFSDLVVKCLIKLTKVIFHAWHLVTCFSVYFQLVCGVKFYHAHLQIVFNLCVPVCAYGN